MKKLTVIALLILTGFVSQAQNNEGLHFGLKITPSMAWLRTDTKGTESDGSKFGFCYGLMTEFRFSDNYSFATGLDVTYRGGKLRTTSESTDNITKTVVISESALTLQYIELPITLKLKTNEIGYLTYYLQAGLAPAINIRARGDIAVNTQTTTIATDDKVTSNVEFNDEDIQDDINNINLSMIIGGGIEYTLSGSTVLLVGIQFNNGFLDVSDDEELKMNSNMLGLSVGILF
ncbi:MAG: porin family protein [Bacteroidota bacterium]